MDTFLFGSGHLFEEGEHMLTNFTRTWVHFWNPRSLLKLAAVPSDRRQVRGWDEHDNILR